MTTLSVNVSDFNKAVSDFADKLPETHLAPFVQKIAFQVLRGVVFKTPVDTGRARAGWQVGIDSDPAGQSGADPNGGETISKGLAVIQRWRPFAQITIVNNVEYIVYLEEGSSKQAPAGMLSLTLQEVASQFP
jgi:Bacteriophage HK97-gp10, putative tail-component